MQVKGVEELGKRWEILGLVQRGGTNWRGVGGCGNKFCCPGEWGNIVEIERERFKDLGIHIFLCGGSAPKSGRVRGGG